MTTPLSSAPVYDATRIVELFPFVGLTKKELAAPGPRPGPREGFVSFLDPGWSILFVRSVTVGKSIFYDQSWYNIEEFASLEEPPRYHQFHMEAVKDSFRKTFDDQQKLLLPDEEVPLARVVIMGIVLHFLATGERLFSTYWVRCQDKLRNGRGVDVGFFGDGGLRIYDYGEADRSSLIGIAADQRF